MDLGIAGRTALVCSSTDGLGEATARALAREGARTVVTGRRAARAQHIAQTLPDAVAIPADLNHPDTPEALVAQTESHYGPIDVLVLNGPGPPVTQAVDVSTPDIDQSIELLVKPQQRLVSLVLEGMRSRRWGRILTIGSSGMMTPLPDLALSNLGRAALAGYLKTLANEVARDGVTINVLIPGQIKTNRTEDVAHTKASRTNTPIDDVHRRDLARIPAGRYGSVDEFGAVATFLCSEHASYITGTAIRCDGGAIPSL